MSVRKQRATAVPDVGGSTSSPADLAAVLYTLARTWSLPDLSSRIQLSVAPRMTRTLARAHPATGRIRIGARVLAAAPDDLLREILCHEAAHVAAFLRHGRRVRPHGREWQALMREAGYEPRVRLAGHAVLAAPAPRRRPLSHELRCPACGWVRRARTTNRHWRCATCVRAGRSGELEVRRLGGRSRVGSSGRRS